MTKLKKIKLVVNDYEAEIKPLDMCEILLGGYLTDERTNIRHLFNDGPYVSYYEMSTGEKSKARFAFVYEEE